MIPEDNFDRMKFPGKEGSDIDNENDSANIYYMLLKAENEQLKKENERLKGLIEKAHKDGYPDHVSDEFKEEMWQQFKTENNLQREWEKKN